MLALVELSQVIDSLRRPWLAALARAALASEGVAARLADAPAGRTRHHAFPGGLLAHTLEVARLCDAACRGLPELDRDLLVVAAILHDLGKVWQYRFAPGGSVELTEDGRLLGHVVMGWELVRRLWRGVPGFPADAGRHLEHLVLSHHGRREWGAPVEPATPEAVALHHADLMSAHVACALADAAGGTERRAAEAG
jgi:3'-5' exoribonuclease